jgi:hypothetical protein
VNLLANPPVISYIRDMMTGPLKSITASLLILLNLAVAVAPHIGHTDEGMTTGTTAELRSHTCGANEIHKDIKDHSDCLLCSRATNFVAFVVFSRLSTDNKTEFVAQLFSETPYTYESASPLFLRGPPAHLS